jgi:hypothetical protein
MRKIQGTLQFPVSFGSKKKRKRRRQATMLKNKTTTPWRLGLVASSPPRGSWDRIPPEYKIVVF